jgi:hypothetical protein
MSNTKTYAITYRSVLPDGVAYHKTRCHVCPLLPLVAGLVKLSPAKPVLHYAAEEEK